MNIWEPLLQGESRVSALNSIETIANEILRLGDEIQTPSALSQSALLFSYLSQEGPSGVYEQTIINLLNRAIGGVSRAEMRASFGLYGGLTGVGWIVEHVSQKMARVDDDSPQLGDEADEDDPLEEIDVALLARLRNGPEFPFYDLISGLVGFGVYFLQRLAHPAARQGLLEVLKLLKQKAEPAAIGITWHTPPEFLPAGQPKVSIRILQSRRCTRCSWGDLSSRRNHGSRFRWRGYKSSLGRNGQLASCATPSLRCADSFQFVGSAPTSWPKIRDSVGVTVTSASPRCFTTWPIG